MVKPRNVIAGIRFAETYNSIERGKIFSVYFQRVGIERLSFPKIIVTAVMFMVVVNLNLTVISCKSCAPVSRWIRHRITLLEKKERRGKEEE